jgi:hypothetical protein
MPVNPSFFADQSAPAADPQEQAQRLARSIVQNQSREELLALVGAVIAPVAADNPGETGVPNTKDELWQYIKDTWNIEIARVAVCQGHDAPFDFIWLGYSEVVPNLFCIGPRGGGKSFDTAMLMELNSRGKPGCESIVFGAVDDQNKKVYTDMVAFFLDQSTIVGEPKVAETVHTNGSVVKSLPGTLAKMNGPHPPKAHSEEVEIFREGPWKESRNMAANKTLKDGRVIKAQNFGTSTRKFKNGRVDKIYQAFLKAKQKAIEALPGASEEEIRERIIIQNPWYVVIYCIFEIAAQVPNCRSAPENHSKPDSELCQCHLVQNGEWDDGSPRTLESVCKGRLYRSRGHRSHGEVIQLFLQNDRGTWEAQQECTEADATGLYVKSFRKARHGLQSFPLDPANGPIYTGTDWGTTDAAAVLWVQYLDRPVMAVDYNGQPKILPQGSRVILAEAYIEGKTSGELGQEAIVKEVKLGNATSGGRIPVRRRWADVQGAGDIRTWNKMGLKVGKKYSTRSFDEHIREMRGMFDADRAFVVVDYNSFTGMGCPIFCDQIESWRADENGKEDRSIPQHLPSAARYVFYGMHDVYQDPAATVQENIQKIVEMATQNQTAAVPVALGQDSGESYDQPTEDWRSSMGIPV